MGYWFEVMVANEKLLLPDWRESSGMSATGVCSSTQQCATEDATPLRQKQHPSQ
jgi:hypothetical protein